jgi:hypothetical protein
MKKAIKRKSIQFSNLTGFMKSCILPNLPTSRFSSTFFENRKAKSKIRTRLSSLKKGMRNKDRFQISIP